MSERIFLPGGRDARGTLDVASEDADQATDASGPSRCVVACPPHPQRGGSRQDRRLRAVSDELTARGVDCLRIEYGPWDGGRGERTDAMNAVAWARERYDRVGLFGYSFGGAVALAAAARGADVAAVAALAPPAHLGAACSASGDATVTGDGIDIVAELATIPSETPVQISYGTHDDVADAGPVVERARADGRSAVEFAADHFFAQRIGEVADVVADFLASALQAETSR